MTELAPDVVRSNARRIVGSLTLTKAGDAVVDAKAVLPYLLAAGAAPAGVTALLVPIRESGALLPQSLLAGPVTRIRRRRLAWSAGSVGQGLAVLAMAGVAAVAAGTALGIGVVASLSVFALCRSLSSIAFKDVLGAAVPAGQRGRVTGQATSAAGLVALTLGLTLRVVGDRLANAEGTSTSVFVGLLAGAAAAWMTAALLFSTVVEQRDDDPAPVVGNERVRPLRLLREDRVFRRFVTARTLLLVSALSPPFVVAMAVEATGSGAGGLGLFVIASGLAATFGGRVWGHRADRSSRMVMATAAGLGATLVTVFLVLHRLDVGRDALPLYVATHFLLGVVHAGSRVGRSTYVVDIAEGDLRTTYVAASNTAMGVLLLVVGGLTSALATLGNQAALASLVLVGAAGVPMARSLAPTATETAVRTGG